MRIRNKMLLPPAVIAAAFAAFLHFVWLPAHLAEAREHLRAEAQADLDLIAPVLIVPLRGANPARLRATLAEFSGARRNWLSVTLHDPGGLRLYPLQDPPSYPAHAIRVEQAISREETVLARLALVIDPAPALAAVEREVRQLEAVLLVLASMTLMVIVLLQRILVEQPLSALAHAAQQLASGDFDTPLVSVANDEVGELVRTFDIMRRARAQSELRQHAAKELAEKAHGELAAYLSAIGRHAIISVAGPDGRIVEVNDKFCEISGYAREDLIGRDHRIVNSGTHPPEFFRDLWAAIARGVAWRGEICNRARDGRLYWVDSAIEPILDAAGQVSRYLSVRLDITARRQAQDATQAAQQFAQSVLDAMPEHIAVLDASGKIVAVNRAWRQSAGSEYALALAVEGRNYLEFCEDAAREHERGAQHCLGGSRSFKANARQFAAGIRAVMRGERATFGLEYPCDTPLEQRWFNGKVARFDSLGAGGAIVAHVNITPRKLAEESLLLSEQRLGLALEASQAGLWEWDMAQGRTFYSPGWWQLLGYIQDDGEPLPAWADLIHPDDVAQMMQALDAHLENRASHYVTEHRKRNAGGEWDWVRETGQIVQRDESGAAQRLVGTLQVVSERVKAEARLRQALEAAQAASAAKSAFLANMGHEVRTPLNGILGMLQLLKLGTLPPEQKDFVETAERSGEALLGLLNDLLDFSKMEAGRVELESIGFDLRLLVEDVVALHAPRAQDKGLEIVCLVAADVPARLLGDPTRLRQVLNNLVGNAVKFTASGEVLVQAGMMVEVEDVLFDSAAPETAAEGKECALHISVADTGVGIAPGKQDKIFEAFSQEDNSITRKFGGTGLGLAVCRSLVEAMGGSIGVSNRVEGGSMFSFSVKLQAGAPEEIWQPHAALAGVRALIADDSGSSRMMLEQYLSRWQISHASATTAEAALSRLRAGDGDGRGFDLALLSHHPPAMDGVALARRIAADPALAGVRVVVLSSKVLAGQAREARALANLTKPVRMHALHDALALALGSGCAAPAQPLLTRHVLAEQSGARGARILVVDDMPVNRKVAAAMLGELGAQAEIAESGEQALHALRQRGYDLVLMDMCMPEMDGPETTRRLRAQEGDSRHTPVVGLTAYDTAHDRSICLEAGMDDFMTKPLRIDALAVALSRWCDKPVMPAASRCAVPSAAAEHAGVLDPATQQQLRALLGESFEETMRTFTDDVAQHIESLKLALAAGSSEALHRHAHAVKGSSENVGAIELAKLCRALQANASTLASGEAETLVREIGQAHERIVSAFAAQYS